MDDFKIKIKKEYSKIKKEAYIKIKPSTCCICGKNITSCCNSHTIPQSILENLDNKSQYLSSQHYIAEDIINKPIGKNKAFTFFLICNECDGTFFKEYENHIEKLNITNEMLNEIYCKNLLNNKYIEMLNKEIFIKYKKFTDDYNIINFLNEKIKYNEIMINNINKQINFNKNEEFIMIYSKILNHKVPIAFQDVIKIEFDFQNNIINNLHSLNDNCKYSFLNLCIFPLKEQTLILFFMNKKDVILNRFKKDFQKKTEKEKLNFIIYFIFHYNDTFLFNHNFLQNEKLNEQIKTMINKNMDRTNFDWYCRYKGGNPELIKYSLKKVTKMPNIFDEKYAIKEE